MERPEKKDIEKIIKEHKKQGATKLNLIYALSKPNGYNEAYDKWQEYLPDIEELSGIALQHFFPGGLVFMPKDSKAVRLKLNYPSTYKLVKAIAKRIGKE